jgi:hypothetical protein
MLSLLTEPLKQFRQGLVLALAVEVCFHVPSAPPALNIWPQWNSITLLAAIFHVIHCLQNTFVPIVYDTHILHILHHNVLQPLKKPILTIIVLPLHKCNGQRKQLIVTVSCHSSQDCSYVFPREKSTIYAKDRSTKFESINAGIQCQE